MALGENIELFWVKDRSRLGRQGAKDRQFDDSLDVRPEFKDPRVRGEKRFQDSPRLDDFKAPHRDVTFV